jgi:hypothetical protein
MTHLIATNISIPNKRLRYQHLNLEQVSTVPTSQSQTEVSSRPERTRISCHASLDKTTFAPFRKEGRMKCINATKFQRKSGVAQWRDLLYSQPLSNVDWKHYPPLCHPERSRGICSSADISWKCFHHHFNCIALCSAQSLMSRQNSSMRFRSVSHEHINRAAPPINV